MGDCLPLASTVAKWGGAVVPARVYWTDDGWAKGSIKGWPSKATSDPSRWPDGWFTWGGAWWVALCPRVGGLIALDCDGPESVDLLREAIALLQIPWNDACPPLSYRTPGHGGGLHVVWAWPPGLPQFSRQVVTMKSGAQIDLRGEGTFLLLAGAPRPDIGEDAKYALTTRPGADGPPLMPASLIPWMESLGDFNVEQAPSLGAKQLSPEGLAALALAQGGKLSADRHVALFRLASYLRVRSGTREFEQLATALWAAVEAHFVTEGEEDHWMQECVRVAKNAAAYTAERDKQMEERTAIMRKALRI